eukprot:g4428.t1
MPRKKLPNEKEHNNLLDGPAMSTRSRAINKTHPSHGSKRKRTKSKDKQKHLQNMDCGDETGVLHSKASPSKDTAAAAAWGTLQAVNPPGVSSPHHSFISLNSSQLEDIELKGEKFTIGRDNCDWNIKELTGNELLCTIKIFGDRNTPPTYSIISHSSFQLKHNNRSMASDEEEPLLEEDSICVQLDSPYHFVFRPENQLLVSGNNSNSTTEQQESSIEPATEEVEDKEGELEVVLQKEVYGMDRLVLDGTDPQEEDDSKKPPMLVESSNEQQGGTTGESMETENDPVGTLAAKDPMAKAVEDAQKMVHRLGKSKIYSLVLIYDFCIQGGPLSTTNKSKNREEQTKEGGCLISSLTESINQSTISPEKNKTSFDTFPYYLSPKLKERLICAANVYFQSRSLAPFIYTIEPVNRRILLTGPTGSGRCMTAIVAALAKETGADLLTFDWEVLQSEADEDNEEEGGAGTSAEELLDGIDVFEDLERRLVTTGESSNLRFGAPRRAPRRGRGRASPSTRPDQERLVSLKKPSASGQSSIALNKTGATAPFRKGDRVIFMGNEFKRKQAFNSRGGGGGGNSVLISGEELGPWPGCQGKVVQTLPNEPQKVGVCFDVEIPGGCNLGEASQSGCGYFCETSDLKHDVSGKKGCQENIIISTFFDIVHKAAAKKPIIIHIKDAELSVLGKSERFLYLKKSLEQLSGPVLVIGTTIREQKKDSQSSALFSKLHSHPSAMLEFGFFEKFGRNDDKNTNKAETAKSMKMLAKLFPNCLPIMPPSNDTELTEWKKCLERDTELFNEDTNRLLMSTVLQKCNAHCPQLDNVAIKEALLSVEDIEKLIGLAIGYRLTLDQTPLIGDGKLIIEKSDIVKGSELFKGFDTESGTAKNVLQEISTENEYEKRLLTEVVPPQEVGVGFEDIGALENVKKTLHEIVMLPLQRPELFARGQLLKPAKGVLLFGPPGTGKTMLAKALAAESGANFLNMSVSSIASKWFGEGEKYVRALFSLAHKIAPCVIFVDEVDSMLGRRDKTNEHEAMRKIKNEFMLNWDGLRTNERDRVLVLAATNRPMDIDEAVIRRMPRRLFVDLPDSENRVKILKTILRHEEVSPEFNYEEIAALTEGYSGSDLKNLCLEAAIRPVRDFLKNEQTLVDTPCLEPTGSVQEEKEEPTGKLVLSLNSKKQSEDGHKTKKAKTVQLRSIQMEDMIQAARQIASSVSSDAVSMTEIRNWNQMYGEGGNRQKTTLSYFM